MVTFYGTLFVVLFLIKPETEFPGLLELLAEPHHLGLCLPLPLDVAHSPLRALLDLLLSLPRLLQLLLKSDNSSLSLYPLKKNIIIKEAFHDDITCLNLSTLTLGLVGFCTLP